MFACLGYNAIRVMDVLCSQFTVPPQYLFRGTNLLAVPRAMSSILCRARTFSSNLVQVILDLFSPRTGWTERFLRVTPDFRLAVRAAFDLIAQPLQPHGKLGPVHARCILLRLKKASLLKRPRFAALAFGHIENDGMSMKLRRSIPIHRAGSVMLEAGGNDLGRRLLRVNIADARLPIPLQFATCRANPLTL